jgi:hypothetical protein
MSLIQAMPETGGPPPARVCGRRPSCGCGGGRAAEARLGAAVCHGKQGEQVLASPPSQADGRCCRRHRVVIALHVDIPCPGFDRNLLFLSSRLRASASARVVSRPRSLRAPPCEPRGCAGSLLQDYRLYMA